MLNVHTCICPLGVESCMRKQEEPKRNFHVQFSYCWEMLVELWVVLLRMQWWKGFCLLAHCIAQVWLTWRCSYTRTAFQTCPTHTYITTVILDTLYHVQVYHKQWWEKLSQIWQIWSDPSNLHPSKFTFYKFIQIGLQHWLLQTQCTTLPPLGWFYQTTCEQLIG